MLSTVTSRTEHWQCSTEWVSESPYLSISQQLLNYPLETEEGDYDSHFVMGISDLIYTQLALLQKCFDLQTCLSSYNLRQSRVS